MSRKKTYKCKKRGNDRFVMLDRYVQFSDAYTKLSPVGRALYLELKAKYNGANNGEIFLSHRDACKRLGVCRNTVAKAFAELQSLGFIVKTQEHYLGGEGYGKAAHYALTELPVGNQAATKDFMKLASLKPAKNS